MDTTEELLEAQAKVMQELGSGQLTPNQAEQIFSLIENRRQLLWIQKAEEQERARELERQRRFIVVASFRLY
jgi:hypothetical protein